LLRGPCRTHRATPSLRTAKLRFCAAARRAFARSPGRYVAENDVADLDLTFAEDERLPSGATRAVSLKSGGASIAVTNKNKNEYEPAKG
jgi:hypothetical protein